MEAPTLGPSRQYSWASWQSGQQGSLGLTCSPPYSSGYSHEKWSAHEGTRDSLVTHSRQLVLKGVMLREKVANLQRSHMSDSQVIISNPGCRGSNDRAALPV